MKNNTSTSVAFIAKKCKRKSKEGLHGKHSLWKHSTEAGAIIKLPQTELMVR